jgi:peptidoglycan hydrolase CwlO-like protein
MKSLFRAALFFLVAVLILSFIPAVYSYTPAPADTITATTDNTPTPTIDITSKLNTVSQKIKDLESHISDLQNKEKSLSSEIDLIDSQIQLTSLKIDTTNQQINTISQDIETANRKINNLEGSIASISKILLNRIVAIYEQGSMSQTQVLLSSNNFSDYYIKMNYLHFIQVSNRKLLYDTEQSKTDYANQKNIYEGKKRQVVALQVQLEEYNKQIADEKISKEELLKSTQNDENEYQRLLSAAKAEMAAIEGVVSSLKFENGTLVKSGQIIAAVGNTGYPDCSTGTHLHFEIRLNKDAVDPSNYLKSGVSWKYAYTSEEYSYWGTINPTGDWNWPLDETIQVNQGYGSAHTYAGRYSDKVHNGIDMISLANNFVRTPKDGTLYHGSTTCGNSPLNFVAVDHGGGLISWYWHVQ